jgi:single-strand DNA-binding protein
MSVNKVILVGSVGKDPEVRMVGEAKVATFSVATNEKYKDSKSGEWKENTEWHNIVCWRNTAELAEKYIKKGTQLYIEGKLRTRSWDKDGEKRYVTEIVADSIQFLGKKEGSDSPAPAPAQQRKPLYQQETKRFNTTPLPTDDDDLPEGDGLPF